MQFRSTPRILFHLPVTLLLILTACDSPLPAPPPATPSIVSFPTRPTSTPTVAPTSDPDKVTATVNPTPSGSYEVSCPATQEVDVDQAATLELGPGPGIPPTSAAGEKLIIVGSVYTEDCAPLVGAMLNVWQTDANGEYGPGHGSNNVRCCYLMGSVPTDAQGHYQLITVKPAHYKGEQRPPPAHIHIELNHPQAGRLETEIVFDNDPYLPQTLQGYILVTLEKVPATEGLSAYLRGTADIILH